jgi:hypothetical protein
MLYIRVKHSTYKKKKKSTPMINVKDRITSLLQGVGLERGQGSDQKSCKKKTCIMLLVREERSVFQSGLATIEIDVQKMLSTI